MTRKDKKILLSMFEELKKAPILYQPSAFWEDLNEQHINHLFQSGLDNFKRTVNTRYFNWGGIGILVHQLHPILNQIRKGNIRTIISSKLENSGKNNHLEIFVYKIYLASLYEYISQIDSLNILENIKEPIIGNPLLVKYKGKLISQDLCNSVHEFYSISSNSKLPKKVKIAELGAGYGRVGYVFLKTLPESTYCVIDIPLGLFIAQDYLSKVFPKEKIFRFRPFKSFKEIQKEFEQSRIKFLMPHQIELLPNKYFDLFINISSLHEMKRTQIKNYINQIDRLSNYCNSPSRRLLTK